ncbi:glycerol kinase-like [Anastrepha ludens]|uniref:glycerol kinase-like n=1 Tax=Anastrepha ludens TaxID=28586 RepID=UPI0023B0C41D|nr:glycerol kinase-like [Anastrepha ludens]
MYIHTGNDQKLIGVIRCETDNVYFSIHQPPDFSEVVRTEQNIGVSIPQPGWFEQDPMEIIEAVYKCWDELGKVLPKKGLTVEGIVAIGITNQRETTILWDSRSGKPLYNAIMWKDIRTDQIVDRIVADTDDQNINHFKFTSGLPLSPYFSALKIRWLKNYVPKVRTACLEGHCKFGTVDSWIVWNLTNGELHVTDVTNASRTFLMNINTLQWDPLLLRTFSVDRNMLPEIRSSSEIYGRIKNERCGHLIGKLITGIIGNHQAALLGQYCVKPGQAKNSYQNGLFLICNTGERCVITDRGLITTVAYKLGPRKKAIYALEGVVPVGGACLTWLRTRLRLVRNEKEVHEHADAVPTTGDVYFVPALTGLYAPYWDKSARGLIIGLTQYTTKKHILRAALEAICFQTRDIVECINDASGYQINKVYVDGELSGNDKLMQLQADTSGLALYRIQTDTISLGAALCAAQAESIDLFRLDPNKFYEDTSQSELFLPINTDDDRKQRYAKWKRAVERSRGWVPKRPGSDMTDATYRLLVCIPAAGFILGTTFMVLLAGWGKK